MKKIIIPVLALIILVGCQTQPKNYATISGKITNKLSDSVRIINKGKTVEKFIPVNADGTFSDTLNVGDGGVFYYYNKNYKGGIFLKNGYDLNISFDNENFSETITFAGEGAQNSLFLLDSWTFQRTFFNRGSSADFKGLSNEELDMAFDKLAIKSDAYYESGVDIDTMLINVLKKESRAGLNSAKAPLIRTNDFNSGYAGKDSPLFVDYTNYDGSKTSLSKLKGKPVYIDIWATWCAPCKAEIPALKELEEEFGDKINFVSISVDDDRANKTWEAAQRKWSKMVDDMDLTGYQLFAPKGFQSEFIQDYDIKAIPRFILIDANGKTISADGIRPSNPKLKDIFESLTS